MSTLTPAVSDSPATAYFLRNLYFARTGFALVWAAVFASTGSSLGALAAILLVVYPAVDAVAAIVDARSTRDRSTRAVTLTNVVISTVAAVGLGVAAAGDIADVLLAWGIWAIVSGLVQLVGAVRRRALGGQRFLMASGGLSVLAGSSFAASSADATSMTGLAGYAVLGGIFFLVSALRISRTSSTAQEA